VTALPGLDIKIPVGPEIINLGQNTINGINSALDQFHLQLQGLLTDLQI